MRTRSLITFVAAAVAMPALAEPLPRDERGRACWLQHTRERTRVRPLEPKLVDFSNLRDGDSVRSPFRVDFAVRGMGVIPAGNADPQAGHHHLLIDTPLPVNVGDAIPFNDGHRHFGKGQTGTVLDLPPGPHRLRLLFADHEHRPYFVYSPEITVNVREKRSAEPVSIEAGCAAWYQEEMSRPRPPGQRVLVANLRDGEPVTSPFSVRLAADGFGIAPRGRKVAGSGHFMLEVSGGGRGQQLIDLSNGATQAQLFLAPGSYTLRARLMDESGSRELAPAAQVNVLVTAQER